MNTRRTTVVVDGLCNCPEASTRRRVANSKAYEVEKTPTGLNMHDCDYVSRRNALIEQAEIEAARLMGTRKGVDLTLPQAFNLTIARLVQESYEANR